VNQQAASKFRALSSPAMVCLLLAAATLAVYWPVTSYDFVNYDDPEYFTDNKHVLAGLTWGGLKWAFSLGQFRFWHPLTWLSLMLDVTLFGKGASGPHFTNLLLHAANAILLFLLLRRMTGAHWRSAVVAALFAWHPLRVESVAWVCERKDVLSAFFGFLALYFYTRAVQSKSGNYAVSLFFFACGLLSKPTVVTLPFVMLLLDYWPLQRFILHDFKTSLPRLILEKIPAFLLSGIFCAITFLGHAQTGALVATTALPFQDRIGNAFVAYASYLGKTFWPVNLAVPYPLADQRSAAAVFLAVALLVGLCLAVVFLARKHPYLFTGWFWFIGMLIPVIGLVQAGNQSMADRFTYLPGIGLLIVLVWGAGEFVAKRRVPRPVVATFIMGLLLVSVWRTHAQIGYWQNSGTLFTHALAVTENNYVAENNLGTWLSGNGQVTDAMEHFQRSLHLQPDNPDALFNLGNAFAKLGNWDGAISNYRRVLQIEPAKPDILVNLGFALAARNDLPGAVTNFEAALKLDPDSADAHNNLATVLFMERRFDEAAQQYREALRLIPDDPLIYANLGDALVHLGNIPDAVKCYQEALRLKPGDASIEARLQSLNAAIPR
jgi:Flp pilus assembly protein TadD